MLRAIIFDFNGVIADDESPHLSTFQQALREHGIALSREEYYDRYLGMDERTCAEALLRAATREREPGTLRAILERKAGLFREYTTRHKPRLFPGVVEYVKEAGKRYRLAIASGGRREQIDYALRGTPIERDFGVIVSAEDVAIGKPDPGIYLLTLKRLNERPFRSDHPHSITNSPNHPTTTCLPGECLVIEDSKAGIHAAKAAGMKVLALATTYPADQLTEADLVVQKLEGISVKTLEWLFH
ncbi:MAG: HAD family hydrolase [Nitrospirales bacterium]